MSEKAPARPRQVTMAAVMAAVGSLVLVVGLFDTLGRLRTPETREAIDEFLAEPPGSSLALDTAQVVDLMRVLVFVSGALAAMTLVFAVFVMKRHRGARIGLTVAAALLLLTVPVAGLMPVFVAVAAALVWSRPGRDWYAGRPSEAVASGGSAEVPPQRPRQEVEDRPAPTPASTPSAQPPPYPYPPYGSSPPQGAAPPAAHLPADRPGPPGHHHGGPTQASDRRPVTVTIAAVLTWVGTGLVSAVLAVSALVLATNGDLFIEEFDRAARQSNVDVNLSTERLLAAGWTMVAVLLLWSLLSALLAIFAFRRSNAARIGLALSAGMTALVSLLLILSGVAIVTLLLAAATLVLLFTGGANEWYARRRGSPSGPPSPPPAGYASSGDPSGRPKPW